jgi:hypothetical protein
MNFTSNCDISALYSSMAKSQPLAMVTFADSKERPIPCELAGTTPSGKKVYLRESGQWTYFYTEINKTNVVLRFDDVNAEKYDPAFQPEVLKMMDSLRPLPKSSIVKGL